VVREESVRWLASQRRGSPCNMTATPQQWLQHDGNMTL
jgi:hypothetical protein